MTDSDLENGFSTLRYLTAISVDYHSRRTAFFEAWNNRILAIGLILGSGAAVTVFEGSHANYGAGAAFLIAVLNSISLVMGVGNKARSHSDLRRQYIDIENLLSDGGDTQDKLNEIQKKKRIIEKDEPPIKRIVSLLCSKAYFFTRNMIDEDKKYQIPRYKRILAHYWDFELPRPQQPT